ncbi:MAG: bifunctional adenosylcobinamide kinase/adenosylcobinamide-phosphate guanylyltransferase [Oleiphilaceae bacterium]|nr:bifunctional adenosylcobinamide kinase/adenosylcobinamide-phosphate guanylyltransferase [Oleiphilaceae bacterium]
MTQTPFHTLVLGGIRSGKSALAEQQAALAASESALEVVYVATATAGDEEMQARIQRHRQSRPSHWDLREEPLALGQVLQSLRGQAPCLLIDCMSLWLSNLLHAGEDTLEREKNAFLTALADYPGPVVVVSNETGLGLVPMEPLSRQFCDQLGWLNQDLAACCRNVVMSVAGLSMTLKGALLTD